MRFLIMLFCGLIAVNSPEWWPIWQSALWTVIWGIAAIAIIWPYVREGGR